MKAERERAARAAEIAGEHWHRQCLSDDDVSGANVAENIVIDVADDIRRGRSEEEMVAGYLEAEEYGKRGTGSD